MCVPEPTPFCSAACDCLSLIPSSSHQVTLSRYPELSYGTHDRCHGDTCHLLSMTPATIFSSPLSALLSHGHARAWGKPRKQYQARSCAFFFDLVRTTASKRSWRYD